MAVEESAIIRVFNQELLLDRILNYVILNGRNVSNSDVRSLRLVNKAWLHSASRCLRKARKPLFYLTLGKYVDPRVSVRCQARELLDKFVNFVTGPSRLEKKVPPIEIKAYHDFFRQENYESLLECFNRCGDSLVDLLIVFSKDGGSMTFDFPNLSLLKLQRCAVLFSEMIPANLAVEESIVGGTNCINLMQQIFSGCKDLQRLSMMSMDEADPPYGFERLVLPTTLSTLDLVCIQKSKHLELLTSNTLTNLKVLTIFKGNSVENGLIYKVLENVRNTLTEFHFLTCSHFSPGTVTVTYFQVPVMKELEVFTIKSIGLELDGNISMLQNKLPKLRSLTLTKQTVEMFNKWTDNSNLTSVEELDVSLVDENVDESSTEFHVSFKREMMQRVGVTFSNLQKLEITVCGTELCGLKCAFENLKRLKILKVNVRKTVSIWNSDTWDALLIGIEVELATALRRTNFWDKIDINSEATPSSIKELTELQELTLGTVPDEFSLSDSLISDAVFKFAFLKMSHLSKLVLTGRFKVSSGAKQEWKNNGRFIN